MSELPNYDAWRLASPAYLEGEPPCANCGHDYGEHGEYLPDVDSEDACTVEGCGCEMYEEPNEAQAREDAAIERWERRRDG